MSTKERTKFSVITNDNIRQKVSPPPDIGEMRYHSNPMYEKLMKYRLEQKHKRFTVEDLLKW